MSLEREREGRIRIPSGCAVVGIMDRSGRCFGGDKIISSIALMHERGNGLGGGFAAYGIYPEYKDFYALHLFYDHQQAREETEYYLNRRFKIELSGPMPTRKVKGLKNIPLIYRYFVSPKAEYWQESELSEEDYMVKELMTVNSTIPGAFVFSSGKNMGVFKGVGYAEDIGDFYRLDEYQGYLWTAHNRFPTNTPGWWGGAHPFNLLNWSVVHNGEISSYDANRRFIEMYGYICTLQTDTEVITYIFDYLVRKAGLSLDLAVKVVAAPFWEDIKRLPEEEQKLMTALRVTYGSLLVNGPFSVIVAFPQGFVALNDRIKLRPLAAAEKGSYLYVASEEAAIREICPQPEMVWSPKGGEPVMAFLENESPLPEPVAKIS